MSQKKFKNDCWPFCVWMSGCMDEWVGGEIDLKNCCLQLKISLNKLIRSARILILFMKREFEFRIANSIAIEMYNL
jgi:hypothetical protein